MAKVYAAFIMNEASIVLFARNMAPEKIDPDLMASFLSAIGGFVREISPTGGLGLKCIEASTFTILIETGERVYGALVVDSRDLIAERYLKALVREFETMFRKELQDRVSNIDVFKPFEKVCDKLLSTIAISSYHIPRLGGRAELLEEIRIPRELWSVLKFVDGRRTVAEIASRAGLSLEETIDRMDRLVEKGLVDVDLSEPVREVARAYEETINSYLEHLRALLGHEIAGIALERAMRKWGLTWLERTSELVVKARDVDRLAWLFTPKEVSDMFSSLMELLYHEVRPLLGLLAAEILSDVRAELKAKHGEKLEKFEVGD